MKIHNFIFSLDKTASERFYKTLKLWEFRDFIFTKFPKFVKFMKIWSHDKHGVYGLLD